MALDKQGSTLGAPATRLFDASFSCDEAPARAGVYRCRCCGEEIAFDSLAADCRCSDECYSESAGVQVH